MSKDTPSEFKSSKRLYLRLFVLVNVYLKVLSSEIDPAEIRLIR